MRPVWDAAIESLLKVEGGFQDYYHDRGNWTGGAVGAGELRGTKYGISAASYPELDIRNLTRDDAVAIYARDFWPQVPEALEPGARWFAFDTAVHSGVGRMRALMNEDASLLGLAALRLKFLAGLTAWDTFGRGWTRRVATVLEDIRAYEIEHDPPSRAHALVLHHVPFGMRWRILWRAGRECVLRGAFVWRARRREDGTRLDVRAE